MKQIEEAYPQASRFMDKAREWQEGVRDTAQKATEATARYVEDNPWKTIAIVAVASLALGFLLRRGD